MSGRSDSLRSHWMISIAIAGGVVCLLALLFRAPQRPPTEPVKPTTVKGVTLVNAGDRVVTEESILLDPTPLFLPTKWNATQRTLPTREAGGRFQGYDAPKLTFGENDLKLGLPVPIRTPGSVADAVAEDIHASPLVGFGRTDIPAVALRDRAAFVEILVAKTGQKVMGQDIAIGPPTKASWQPVEFLARIDAAGLVGRPMVTSRSGVDDVDAFFANYLVRTLRIGERLEPGFYRISIGP